MVFTGVKIIMKCSGSESGGENHPRGLKINLRGFEMNKKIGNKEENLIAATQIMFFSLRPCYRLPFLP